MGQGSSDVTETWDHRVATPVGDHDRSRPGEPSPAAPRLGPIRSPDRKLEADPDRHRPGRQGGCPTSPAEEIQPIDPHDYSNSLALVVYWGRRPDPRPRRPPHASHRDPEPGEEHVRQGGAQRQPAGQRRGRQRGVAGGRYVGHYQRRPRQQPAVPAGAVGESARRAAEEDQGDRYQTRSAAHAGPDRGERKHGGHGPQADRAS